MNKDETIEQMAKDLVDEIEFDITFYDFNGSAGIRFDYVGTAKNVVEKGYRKIADDEVVLKQDEVWEFRKDHAVLRFLKDKIKQEYATFQQTVALRIVKDIANELGIDLE